MPGEMAAPWLGETFLRYSRHAIDAASSDRYGSIQLEPKIFVGSANQVVEVTIGRNGLPEKAVVRLASSAVGLDIILVLMVPQWRGPDSAEIECFVKTVWFNRSTDKHRTLDRSRYVDLTNRRISATV